MVNPRLYERLWIADVECHLLASFDVFGFLREWLDYSFGVLWKRKGSFNQVLKDVLEMIDDALWASVRAPTDSVPATQSPKREVGMIALKPQARAC